MPKTVIIIWGALFAITASACLFFFFFTSSAPPQPKYSPQESIAILPVIPLNYNGNCSIGTIYRNHSSNKIVFDVIDTIDSKGKWDRAAVDSRLYSYSTGGQEPISGIAYTYLRNGIMANRMLPHYDIYSTYDKTLAPRGTFYHQVNIRRFKFVSFGGMPAGQYQFWASTNPDEAIDPSRRNTQATTPFRFCRPICIFDLAKDEDLSTTDDKSAQPVIANRVHRSGVASDREEIEEMVRKRTQSTIWNYRKKIAKTTEEPFSIIPVFEPIEQLNTNVQLQFFNLNDDDFIYHYGDQASPFRDVKLTITRNGEDVPLIHLRKTAVNQPPQKKTLKSRELLPFSIKLNDYGLNGKPGDLPPGRYEIRAKYSVNVQEGKKLGITPAQFDRTILFVDLGKEKTVSAENASKE